LQLEGLQELLLGLVQAACLGLDPAQRNARAPASPAMAKAPTCGKYIQRFAAETLIGRRERHVGPPPAGPPMPRDGI
jgi:hypothetical protein